MKKDLLEQIIRQVLNEGQIRVSLETLRPEDEARMKKVHDLIGISSKLNKETDKFSTADGVIIKVQRIGGRLEDTKSFEITDKELMDHVMYKLNTLAGTYSKMNGPEYVWLVSRDVNLGKRDLKKPKEKRVITSYMMNAFYVKRSLFNKTISTSTTGYFGTTSKGALVFDLQKINETQWKSTFKTGAGEVQQITDLGYPVTELTYKSKSLQVPVLFNYLAQNLYKVLTPDDADKITSKYKGDQTYGDYHKALVEAFQREQNLTVTGNWDEATLKRAQQLEETIYTFTDTTDLKTRIDAIFKEETKQEVQLANIIVPAAGFKYGETTGNAEFYKVQIAMIDFCKKMGVPSWPTDIKDNPSRNENNKLAIKTLAELEKALQDTKQHGTYGNKTQAVVKTCKLILTKMLMPPEMRITLLNTSTNVVDQQFVTAIITTK
jgi:peptidoglycan hydrolase-like protein with peptidoglycan-binding domain